MAAVAKDHKCPHDGHNLTGYEVCRICDFATCSDCGSRFNQRDMLGGPRCYPCQKVVFLEHSLKEEEKDRDKRRQREGWKPAISVTKE